MKKLLYGFALLLLADALNAQEPKFMRLREADGKAVALEIAVTRYQNKTSGVTVDLVGVVHIGDRGYYEKLNARFPTYDAVLYELVGPPGTTVPNGGKKDGALGLLTSVMTTALGLDSQLAVVDYRAKNFVHADLSFEAMLAAAKERGDNGLSLGLSIAADMIRQQNLAAKKKGDAAEDVDLAALLTNPTRLKRELARQMIGGAELGPTLQGLLVADRNQKACQVLTRQIVDGKKKLAIFYGAAHMPDFDRRLRDEFGLVRQNQEWFTAWDLRERDDDPARLLRGLLQKALED